MNMSKIIWGFNFYIIVVEAPIMPNDYLKYPKMIPNTSNIGV